MATFTEDFTRMRDDCDRSRNDRRQFSQDMSAEVQQHKNEAHALLGSFHSSRAEVATQLRNDLADFTADLRIGGEIFRGS